MFIIIAIMLPIKAYVCFWVMSFLGFFIARDGIAQFLTFGRYRKTSSILPMSKSKPMICCCWIDLRKCSSSSLATDLLPGGNRRRKASNRPLILRSVGIVQWPINDVQYQTGSDRRTRSENLTGWKDGFLSAAGEATPFMKPVSWNFDCGPIKKTLLQSHF